MRSIILIQTTKVIFLDTMDSKNKNMVRKYIIDTLKKIKEIDEKVQVLYKHGVDIIELENGISQLERSISVVIRQEEDEKFKCIQDFVGWWLYETVEKIIWYGSKEEIEANPNDVERVDLTDLETFVDYLINEYGNQGSSL